MGVFTFSRYVFTEVIMNTILRHNPKNPYVVYFTIRVFEFKYPIIYRSGSFVFVQNKNLYLFLLIIVIRQKKKKNQI